MPYPNEHAARILNPKGFDGFARQKIAPGIYLILGIKNGKSTAQAYRFKKKLFTPAQARNWLKEHNVAHMSFEEASDKMMMQSFSVNIQCLSVKQLSQDEILNLIPTDKLEQIKQFDKHPYFTAYSICHEGTSTPKILNEQSKPITWLKKAIQSIKNKKLAGIKFFRNHNQDNSTNNREEFGEVIANTEKEINGILHHIVIGYHPANKVDEVKKMDICSQEGVWNLIDEGANFLATTLDKITGIALGKSDEETPAFAGAQRLGIMQAFNNNEDRSNKRMSEIDSGELLNKLTFNQLRTVARDKQVWPNQIFDEEHIKNDRVFGKVYAELEKAQEKLKEKDSKINELQEVVSTYENVKKEATRREQLETAKTRFKKMLTDDKWTDQMIAYAEINFDPNTIQDLSDLSLTKVKSNIQKSYETLAATGLIKTTSEEKPPVTPKDNKGTNQNSGEPKDYTKKENNPYLEEDVN